MDKYDVLEKLSDLKERWALTEDEFSREKRKLLWGRKKAPDREPGAVKQNSELVDEHVVRPGSGTPPKIRVDLFDFVLFRRIHCVCRDCGHAGRSSISDVKYQGAVFATVFPLAFALFHFFGAVWGIFWILVLYLLDVLVFRKLGMVFTCQKCWSANVDRTEQ